MRKITKYVADDGSEWTTKKECQKRDTLCTFIDSIMKTLPKRPGTCKFANGDGYIQHSADAFYAARAAILKLALKHGCDCPWVRQSLDDTSFNPSYAGYVISEVGGPLSNAWNRFMCTDKQLREWGQPYFRTHPEEATQKRLNKK